jgi:hypothetical protein
LVLDPAVSSALPYGRRTEVVLVGHFDDRRSSECTRAWVARCADLFWVDAVWLDGEQIPGDWVEPVRGGESAIHSHGEAWDRVRGPDEDPLVPLSVGQITSTGLHVLEPATVGVIPAEMWNWHITAYEPSSGRLRTFVIPDSVVGNVEGFGPYEVLGAEVSSSFTIID